MIGDWEISVIDYALGDTGTLNSWSLEFCSQTATLNNRDINEPEDNLDVKVFPNPNEGSFTITFNSKFNNSDVKVIMRDVRGRTIFKKTYSDIVDFSENIKLDNTQSGMYFLTIIDGAIYTNKKVIIN